MPTHTKSKASILLVALLSLSMIACSTSTVVNDIQIVVDAVSAAAPIVAVFAGPGAAVISGYLTAAANGLNCVLTAAESPSATSVSIAAAMVACLGAAVVPTLPPGVPPLIANLITVISKEITNLIIQYGLRRLELQAEAPVENSS